LNKNSYDGGHHQKYAFGHFDPHTPFYHHLARKLLEDYLDPEKQMQSVASLVDVAVDRELSAVSFFRWALSVYPSK
jgi:hypothetical protein